MGAAENADVVRRGYAAFNSADSQTLTELMDENAAWYTPGRGPLAGRFAGRDAVVGQFGQYERLTTGTFRAKLQQVLVGDDGRVVGIHHNTAERDGKQLDVGCCIVFEVENGRMVSGRERFSDLYAWDEYWS